MKKKVLVPLVAALMAGHLSVSASTTYSLPTTTAPQQAISTANFAGKSFVASTKSIAKSSGLSAKDLEMSNAMKPVYTFKSDGTGSLTVDPHMKGVPAQTQPIKWRITNGLMYMQVNNSPAPKEGSKITKTATGYTITNSYGTLELTEKK